MDITRPLPLLGGLSPETFMRRHWHKRPLLVRQALPGVAPPLPRRELFALAARDDVESRLVEQRGEAWHVRQGPLARRALPPLSRDGWTLLVQGLDLHNDAAHELLSRFRFVPDARLDDLMLSYATHGGGVGPHFDSYDVFLIQVQGARRWRVGRGRDLTLRDDVPLKILANFEPEHEWLLEPGEWLSEPKPTVWFEPGQALRAGSGAQLDRRTRMLYDARHAFINGEAFVASGRDATLMRKLADARHLSARDVAALSPAARELLGDWAAAGWV